MDSELVVLRGAGLNGLSLAKPAMIVALLATLLSYFISLYASPTSYRAFKDEQTFIRHNYASLFLQEGVFNTPIKGLTVYIHDRSKDGLMEGILAYDNRLPDMPSTIIAQSGNIKKSSQGLPSIKLINGNITRGRDDGGEESKQTSLLFFESYELNLSPFTDVKGDRWREPQERYLGELFYPEDTEPQFLNKLKAEGHQRLTWPFYNLVLTFIAIVFLLPGQFNRRGQWRRIFSASVLSASLLIFAIGFNHYSAKLPMVIPLMYANIIIAIIVCLYVLDDKKSKLDGGAS